jgi:hypothetical protein
MMNSKFFNILLLLAGLASSCIDPYYPDLDKYKNTLAVDGLIDNEPGPYYIRLQLSTTVYYPEYRPLGGATVFVTDNLGNVEEFIETEEGVYTNASPDFQGITGHSYQLTISLSETEVYHSSWEKIQEALGIDTVYAEIEGHIDPNTSYNLLGYQFYIDTDLADNDSTYLIWRLEHSYKFESDFKCHFFYAGSVVPFPNSDSLKECWKTENVPTLLIGSTKSSNEKKLSRFPLHYVSTEGRELSVRYSVLVKQYTVSENVYNYWKSLQDQNDIQGSLYTQQPYQIRGNMQNINDPDEAVAGSFVAAGISQKRLYFNRPPLKFNYPICELGEADYMNMMDLSGLSSLYWPVYLTMDGTYRLAYPNQDCIDCRQSGGSLDKPDFWID